MRGLCFEDDAVRAVLRSGLIQPTLRFAYAATMALKSATSRFLLLLG